jgi:antibiotic biosynthesis monooxygenase (ABM) superfamily enzyme
MWAQLITARLKPGNEDGMLKLQQEFEARGKDGSTGWVRSITLQNQNDPQEYYNLVFFESEEKARENERSPRQAELIGRFQAMFEGPPQYVNLLPTHEATR